MKLEIKEDMYVRTKKGIRKIIEIDEDDNYYIDKTYINDFGQEINCISDSCIIGEPSFNIIDLIEVGDYVNGQKVYYNEEFNALYVRNFDEDGDFYETFITKKSFIDNIESIVTKEQFEEMCYKVGE